MVGLKIKEYLEENGIKQSFVAEKVGIAPAQMSEICNNLEECKGKIKAGIVLNWEFGFAELLDEDFLDDDLSLDNDRGY